MKLLKNGLKGEEAMENLEKIRVLEKRSPKIFLSGSIRGGRQLIDTYRFMFDTLEEVGVEVLSWHGHRQADPVGIWPPPRIPRRS